MADFFYVDWKGGSKKVKTYAAAKRLAKKKSLETGYARIKGSILGSYGHSTLAEFREGQESKVENPTSLLGEWIPAHAVRMLPNGQVQILKEKNPGKLKNIAEGFMDGNGVFHPIRAARDYDPDRGGDFDDIEESSRKRVVKKKKASKAKKRK